MDKSMVTGVLGGVALATAGGVAGFVLLGEPAGMDEGQGTAVVEPEQIVTEQPAPVVAAPAPVAPAPAKPVAAPRPAVAAAPAPAPTPAPVQQRCWDEEVTVPVEVKDENRIAGTTAGALLGGAIAKKIGDDNKLLTAAGAVGGALAGRKIQQEIQENNTTTVIEHRCEPIG